MTSLNATSVLYQVQLIERRIYKINLRDKRSPVHYYSKYYLEELRVEQSSVIRDSYHDRRIYEGSPINYSQKPKQSNFRLTFRSSRD